MDEGAGQNALTPEGDSRPGGKAEALVMRMLESELRHAHVPTAWFNAWHKEGEEQMLAFLLESIWRIPADCRRAFGSV